jgi:hypothetical protein
MLSKGKIKCLAGQSGAHVTQNCLSMHRNGGGGVVVDVWEVNKSLPYSTFYIIFRGEVTTGGWIRWTFFILGSLNQRKEGQYFRTSPSFPDIWSQNALKLCMSGSQIVQQAMMKATVQAWCAYDFSILIVTYALYLTIKNNYPNTLFKFFFVVHTKARSPHGTEKLLFLLIAENS